LLQGFQMTDSTAGFIHLRAHSAYSLLEGALPLAALLKLAEGDQQPALGIGDRNNLFGALEFSEKAADKGIQPIIGCALSVRFTESADPSDTENAEVFSLALIAQNEEGYLNLLKLMSAAYLSTDDQTEIAVSLDSLINHAAGLICLTGGHDGPIDMLLGQNRAAYAAELLVKMVDWFPGRLYVELQRHNLPEQRIIEPQLLALAYDHDLPLVATNQPYFASAGDHEAQDALMCIANGVVIAEPNRRRLTAEHYFKTRSEMLVLFADLPEATANTIEIAQRCAYRPRTGAPMLPRYTRAQAGVDQLQAESDELARQAREGLATWLSNNPLAEGRTTSDYEDRLEFELEVITRMQYPGYFLIVADFIKWAKNQDIPVGPGRGSGAGSLVALSLTITDLDPLRFSLLFERFLNPDRVSMPDFDIDFCQERRDEVIRYVQTKYGRDQVAQIITFGSLQARAVLRDVGRVLQMPYGQVDRLCKMVPNNPANPTTLAQAVENEEGLRKAMAEEPIVEQLINISLKLEGLFRHASTHAAGIVIGDRPLDELVPMYRDPRSDMPVTQFNMKWVEPAGLVKFDFLGLWHRPRHSQNSTRRQQNL
jgi:DNA polymerase-3 subunit alpha